MFRLTRIALLAALGQIAIFVEAAPVGLAVDAWPSPDLLLCVVAYWALRRPGSTPLVLVFLLGLSRDLLTDAPLGAGTLTLIAVAETLKHYRLIFLQRSFMAEWLAVILAVAASLALQWLLLMVMLVEPAPLATLALMAFITACSYPPLAMVLRWLFRIRWRRPERTAAVAGFRT